jgi:hypothetical protein
MEHRFRGCSLKMHKIRDPEPLPQAGAFKLSGTEEHIHYFIIEAPDQHEDESGGNGMAVDHLFQ